MSLTFVNLKGEAVAVPPPGAKKVGKKSSRATVDTFHKGWLVVGFSPEQLAAARREHDAAPPVDGREKKEFDEVLYMRTAAPGPVQSQGKGSKSFSAKVFEIESSADRCAEMVKRMGWKAVRVQAKAKGGK